MKDKTLKLYNKMSLDDKREIFEVILWSDVIVFNMEHEKLDDSLDVCHVSTNGIKIQLTVHKDSDVAEDQSE